MPNYYTPGVYVEEIPTLPPSVVDASTAIPAFIGYTERTASDGVERLSVPTRISTMLEFKQYFGGPPVTTATVSTKKGEGGVILFDKIETFKQSVYILYYALDLFFKNGGSYCYIVSAGIYSADASPELNYEKLNDCLTALEKEDEPTLIVLTEACGLKKVSEYHTLCTSALAQCAKVKNRFCILDVPASEKVAEFRTGLSSDYLRYGAAYYPYLKTTISAAIEDINVKVTGIAASAEQTAAEKAAAEKADAEKAAADKAAADAAGGETPANAETAPPAATIADKRPAAKLKASLTTDTGQSLADIKTTYTALYSAIKTELNNVKYKLVLPPSAAVAGVYAATDRDRGVWKAPANVGLSAVIEPTEKITATQQEELNVHVNGGKSINAIRAFTGRGISVWGARTLAGNDNEWRYVSVRRLFNMIEDSVSKASSFAVFESNDPTTWLKVQSMIDSYLYGLWQQGALVGPSAKAAYFVKVGLGITMTSQDILEGRLIVEIGVAAVRPAEFIILRFSHKLQEA